MPVNLPLQALGLQDACMQNQCRTCAGCSGAAGADADIEERALVAHAALIRALCGLPLGHRLGACTCHPSCQTEEHSAATLEHRAGSCGDRSQCLPHASTPTLCCLKETLWRSPGAQGLKLQ
jgi:hypothetical protein